MHPICSQIRHSPPDQASHQPNSSMPLPSFLQRFRQRAQEPVSGAVPMSSADIEQARVRARRRLVGMVVLVVAGVIGFPWLFETQPRPMSNDVQVVAASATRASGVVVASVASGPAPVIASVTPPAAPPQRVKDEEPKEEFIEDAPAPEKKRVDKPADKPAKPAAKPADKPAETRAVAAVAPAAKPAPAPAKAASKPTAKPAVAAASAPKGKASAPAASAKTAQAASKPAADNGSDRYIVQVGAFADVAAAREVRMKVERLGIKTYTQEVTTDGTKKVRVRVGPFASKAEADKAAASLRKAGLTGAVLTL